uniref:Uncharacterized protein n=1 Tax=Cacopsylla melanoneura TaxID=428564 RepID=A0A8D8M2M0_9HEMI
MTWATGAAVAVRHERRRHEKRSTNTCPRPTELNLPTSPMSYSSSPILPQTSPSGGMDIPEIYICKFQLPLLQIIVVSLVLGAILLIVGLVQLKPGAGASQHKFLLLGSGIFLLIFGIILAFVRCCLLPWSMKQKRRKLLMDEETALQNGTNRTRTPSRASLQTPSHMLRHTPTSTINTSITSTVHTTSHHHHTHHSKPNSSNHHTHVRLHGDVAHDKGTHSSNHHASNDVHVKPDVNGESETNSLHHPTCSIQVENVDQDPIEGEEDITHRILVVAEPTMLETIEESQLEAAGSVKRKTIQESQSPDKESQTSAKIEVTHSVNSVIESPKVDTQVILVNPSASAGEESTAKTTVVDT